MWLDKLLNIWRYRRVIHWHVIKGEVVLIGRHVLISALQLTNKSKIINCWAVEVVVKWSACLPSILAILIWIPGEVQSFYSAVKFFDSHGKLLKLLPLASSNTLTYHSWQGNCSWRDKKCLGAKNILTSMIKNYSFAFAFKISFNVMILFSVFKWAFPGLFLFYVFSRVNSKCMIWSVKFAGF